MIKENIIKTRMQERSITINKDYKKCLESLNQKFNLIFIDPPYKKDIAVDAVNRLIEYNLLAKDGVIVIETDEDKREEEELENIKKLEIYDKRKYGRIKLLFLHERG